MILAKIDYSHTYVTGTQTNGQVFISLFDADTGQPVNGNNVIVTYLQNINGTVYNGSATIAGQTAAIYSGLLGDTASRYYATFTITNVGQVPNPAPPVNRCDLAVSFINVDHPESAPGAADGQITVSASSSYGPLTYSLDGATYQNAATFTGLTGGVKTIYITDANACIITSTVTLPTQNSLLVGEPSVTLPRGNISRWNAAFNPVVFSYQRKDFDVTTITADTQTGNALLTINCDTAAVLAALNAYNTANTNAANINVVLTGNNPIYIYVKAGPYQGTFQVLQVPAAGQILINTPYLLTATGFVNINLLRPYYQVRTQITYQDPISSRQNAIVSTNRPNATGLINADISNFLQSLLRAKDDSNFTDLNYRDSNLSASYQVAYAEYWEGKVGAGQTLTYLPVAQTYYVLYAAKQLGDKFGGNLAAYVPFPSVTDNSQLAQWVTDFAEPAYSNNYPFDIGFIYGDALLGRDLYCKLTMLDINRNALPGGTQNINLLNEDGSWLLNQDGSRLVIAGANTANIPVPVQLGLNRLMVNTAFNSSTRYFTLALMYNDGDNLPHAITQTQTIRIDDAVDANSVYLRWIGLTGCWNYYRFVYNQEVSLDVQNAVIIKNYVTDWANQDGIEEVISKNAGQKIKVMAEDLSIADIKGLQSIKYSPKVQMLVAKNPVRWQTIVLNTATFSEYETLNGVAPFSVTFNLPGINIQTQ